MPGRPATDQQMRMYMKLRCHHPQHAAAAKAGFSERTGRRIEGDPRLPTQKSAERPLRRKVADPLGSLWESDILPLLVTRPGMRPVMLLDEMQRRHPERDWVSNRLQQRPPFRAQSRPLLGLIELCGVAFAGVGRLWVSGLPEQPWRVWRRQATYP